MHPPQNTYFKMHLISMNIALHFSTSQNPLKTHPSLNHYIYIMKNTNTYPPPHDLLPFIPHNITSLPSLPTHIINFPLSPQHYTYRCFPLALIQGPLAPTTSLLVNHNLRPSLPSLPSFHSPGREEKTREGAREATILSSHSIWLWDSIALQSLPLVIRGRSGSRGHGCCAHFSCGRLAHQTSSPVE